MGKKERIIAHILSGMIGVLTISVFLLSVFFYSTSRYMALPFGFALAALFSVISLSDFIKLLRGNLTIGCRIVRYIKYKRRKSKPMLVRPACSAFQRTVCEGINAEKFGSLVHIYGFPDRGKTTASFFALQGIFLNAGKNIAQVKNVTLIDCSIDRAAVLALFDSECDRIRQFQNCIVVLDHIECLGARFLELNKELFLSEKNIFILIEDSEKGGSLVARDILENAKRYDFNSNILEYEFDKKFFQYLDALDEHEKYIFFAIYFSIYTQKYVTISLITQITKRKKREVKLLLKRLRETGPFALFPFNKNYIYCTDLKALECIPYEFNNYRSYCEMLQQCVDGTYFNEEGRWLCFIQNSADAIAHIPQEQRFSLFNSAIKHGRYKKLYQSLSGAILTSIEKEVVFCYEYGVLSFFMGEHQKAFNFYQSYLDGLDASKKMEAMIHIIESIHGSNSNSVKKKIESFLRLLRETPGFEVYSKYWDLHISIEKGKFDVQTLRKTAVELEKAPQDNHLYHETLKRCYTDLFRCYYLLGEDLPEAVTEGFIRCLQERSSSMYSYYFNLCIKANRLHYLVIPEYDAIERSQGLEQLVNEADEYYNNAARSEHSDEKSRRTLLVKQSDLRMMMADADTEQIIKTVEQFLVHSQANDVAVHEAYCETLLAKFKIISNCNFKSLSGTVISDELEKELLGHLYNAEKIYKEYDNVFGVFRVDFLRCLYVLYATSEYDAPLKRMEHIVMKFPEYKREYRIWKEITNKYQKEQLTKMFLLWRIKSYPMVLQ